MRPRARLLVPLATALVLALVATVTAPLAQGARSGVSDVVAFSRDLTIDQPVPGDVVVMNGSATIDQPVTGDVLVLGGSVTFRGAGRVQGDLACIGGRVTNADGRVRGDFFAPGSLNQAIATVVPSNAPHLYAILAIALKLTLLIIWMVATLFVTLVFGREVRQSSIEVRSSPLHTFAVGLVAYTSFILTAIIFASLVPFLVGIPLLIMLAVVAILAKVFGTVAVFHAVGTYVAGPRTREQLERRRFLRGDLAMTLVGLLVLGAIRMIPVVGTIAWGVASLFGVGVALATAFGRREPWFLAYRAVET
jgi:hypothetical protein